MSAAADLPDLERVAMSPVRALANQAFSRAAGAPLIPGNRIRLLKDAEENYPAWLDAIRAAKRHILFESYIIHEDDAGRMFADVLVAKAMEGVRVRLIYDWLGNVGPASRAFWNRLRAGGASCMRGQLLKTDRQLSMRRRSLAMRVAALERGRASASRRLRTWVMALPSL